MRKITVVLVLLFLLSMAMGGCSSKTDPLLNYPGLSWGMTVEEAIAALELPADTDVTDYGRSTKRITVENRQCMGQTAAQVLLSFRSMQDETWRLYSVQVFYPDGTDMRKVAKAVREAYGDSVEKVCLSPFPEYLGSDEHNLYWGCTLDSAECRDEPRVTALREVVAGSVSYELTDQKWQDYLAHGAMTRIHWSDQYQALDPYAGFQNVLIFQGSPLVEILWN